MSTSTVRGWWSDYRCLNQKPASLHRPIQLFGRSAGYCAEPAYEPFMAMEMALESQGYSGVKSVWIPRNCPTGIGGQTCQLDGTDCSLHNYGVAVDIDPYGHGNPHFRRRYGDGWNFSDCKFTADQVEAVESILNVQGEQLFRWLGWLIGDTMHFEQQVRPTRTQVDWATVPGDSQGDDEQMLPLMKGHGYEDPPEGSLTSGDQSHRIEDVRALQDMLNLAYNANLKLDGLYGGATVTAVKVHTGSYTGYVEGQNGNWFGGNQWGNLIRDLSVSTPGAEGPPGPPGPPGERGPRGLQGPEGTPGEATLVIKGAQTIG